MNSGRILLASDDLNARRSLRSLLAARYEVHSPHAGDSPRQSLLHHPFDLTILDSSLPCPGVLELCRQFRETSEIALIVLARCESEPEKIAVFDAGADDCVAKPYSALELLARIRALLRRLRPAPTPDNQVVQLDGLQINLVNRRVISRGKQVHLTPKEFDLLQLLVANPNATIPHTRLLRTVWGHQFGEQTTYLRVMINQLRRKIEPDPSHPRYLLTEPWVGYRFEMPDPLC
jgi:two-component system, OmpR family, KDP operon response regulator KdpE